MEHRPIDPTDALRLAADMFPTLLTALSGLLGLIFGIGLFKYIFNMIRNVFDEYGDDNYEYIKPKNDEKPKNEKPKGLPVEAEYDAQDVDKKPKRKPWKIGDDGEIITLDDLGIEAEDTQYFHHN